MTVTTPSGGTSAAGTGDEFSYSGLQVSFVASASGASQPTAASGVPAAQADITPMAMAVDQANGDEAILSQQVTPGGGGTAVYLVAGTDLSPEYGLNNGASPLRGDMYLLAGVPGQAATSLPPSPAATTSNIDAYSLAFDNQGNLLIGMSAGGSPPATIYVVPRSGGTFYGMQMTTGQLYLIASTTTPASTSVSHLAVSSSGVQQLPGSMSEPQLLAVDSAGNIVVGQSRQEIVFIDEETDGERYGAAVHTGNAYAVAGTLTGTGTYLPNGELAFGPTFSALSAMTLDAQGDILFTAAENVLAEGGQTDTVWVLPATNGEAAGVPVPFPYYGLGSVTAGHLYVVAGTLGQGTIEQANDVAALKAQLDRPDGIVVDSAGNLVVSDSGGGAIIVVAESPTAAYGVSPSEWTEGMVYTIDGPVNGAPTTVVPGPAATFSLSGRHAPGR